MTAPAHLFPLFLKLSGRKVVVVGGGEVAAFKVQSLLPTRPKITGCPRRPSYVGITIAASPARNRSSKA